MNIGFEANESIVPSEPSPSGLTYPDIGPNVGNESEEGASQNAQFLSKNQQKKLKRKREWEAGREDRKLRKKFKDKERKVRQREAGLNEMPNQSDSATCNTAARPAQNKDKQRSEQVPVTIIYDCSFDDLMTESEIKSLASQLTRVYSDNRNATYRVHIAISSFNKRLRQRFENVLGKTHHNWKGIKFFDEDYVEVAKRAQSWMTDSKNGGSIVGALTPSSSSTEVAVGASELQGQSTNLVYLSSESPETLTHLKPYNSYVIGGLVDRNRHKGICYKRACSANVKTAKLPIGEFMQMQSRQVLATNHVGEIILKWIDSGDWGTAFVNVIPKRKGGSLIQALKVEDEHSIVGLPTEQEATEVDDTSSGALSKS